MVPSQVYKANLSEIDELSNIEVEVLTAYYGYVSNTPSVLNSFEETKESLLDPEIAAQNISNQLDVGEFDRKEESIIKDLIKTIYAKNLEDEDLADELRDMEEDIKKSY